MLGREQSGGINGRTRKARVVLAALALLVTLVCAGGVTASTDIPLGKNGEPILLDYKPATAPPGFNGFPPPSEEQRAAAESQAADEKAARESPAAQLERLRSRTAYQDATLEEAIATARLEQRPVMEMSVWEPLKLREGDEFVRYIGTDQAEVDVGKGKGKTRVQSVLPLRTENENGDLAPTDLRLEDRVSDFRPKNPLVDVRLPKRLADGISLPDSNIGIHMPDATGADGTLVDGKLFWGNVAADTDSLAMVLPDGVETFWQLRSQDSPEVLRQTLSLPAGATLRRKPGWQFLGALEVVKDEKVLATIGAPHTWDADGQPVPTRIEYDGTALTVRVDHRGRDVAYPLMVDPTYTVTEAYDFDEVYDGWLWYTANRVTLQSGLWMQSESHYGWPNYLNDPQHCAGQRCNAGDGPGLYTGRLDNVTVGNGDWSEWVFYAANAGEINLERSELSNRYVAYSTNAYVYNFRGLTNFGGWVASDWRLPGGWNYKVFCTPYQCDVPTNGQNAIATVDMLWAGSTGESQGLYTYLASGYIWLTDDAPPRNVSANYQGPTGWVDTANAPAVMSAQDTGVGVKAAYIVEPGGDAVGAQVHPCRGDRHGWCPPNNWNPTVDHSTNALDEGSNLMHAEVSDAWGNEASGGSWRVKVDRSPPTIALSDSLWNARDKIVRAQPYQLRVDVTDGTGPDLAARAGVQEVEIKIDGVSKKKVTTESCTATENCKPDPFTWEFDGAEVAEGKHTISVVARDRLHPQAGHASVQNFAVTVKHAANTQVGPGSVDLYNGSLAISADDVSIASFGSSLSLTRTYDSYKPANEKNGVFGPGWTASVPVDEAGADYAGLAEEPDGSLTLRFADATAISYTKTGAAYSPPAGFEDLKLAAGATNTFSLTDSDDNVTTFGARTVDPSVAGRFLYAPVEVRQQGVGKTVVSYEPANGILRPTRALAPPPNGVDCSGSLQPGCRALTFVYAPATTATGLSPIQWGDFKDRLARVDFTAYDQATGQMAPPIAVAQYSYDSNGLLRAAWDPRISPELKTTYDYDGGADGNNRLTAIAPPGQSTWNIAYANALPDDPNNTWRVNSVSRSTPQGMATTTMAYRVPVSGSGAPYQMSPEHVGAWGQGLLPPSVAQTQSVPQTATAIFPPDHVPGSPPASYSPAEVHYLDKNGREVNVAAPGGRITTREYDDQDNVVRELSAENRRRVLAGEGAANQLDTQRSYSADGLEMNWELGPRHEVRLASGQTVQARQHTKIDYNEGAPTQTEPIVTPFHLPTTTTVSAQLDDGSKVDARVTKQSYDWTLRKETAHITDPAGLNLKKTTIYNSAGLVTESRRPAGPDGGTAHTTKTIYYTAASNPDDSGCGNKPQWANLACKTKPAAQPGIPGRPAIPETTYTYDRYGQVLTEVDQSDSTTRTTTNSYDNAGRKTRTAVESSTGTSLPAVELSYSPTTGLPTTTQTTEDSTTRTVTRGYDSLGRQVSYTDADGNTSTTTYDLRGRVVTTDDGKGTQTRAYDSDTGDLSQLTDSALGTISGEYDADGKLTRQVLANGLRQESTYNEAGEAVRLKYSKSQAEAPLFPRTSVLDDFSGADENPLAGNWSGPIYGWHAKGRRTNGTATSASTSWGGMYWNAATYSGDAEVFATILQEGDAWLYLHWDPVNKSGYALEYSAANNIARIVRITNGNEARLNVAYIGLSAGDTFGLSKRGDVLQMWRKPAGGSWALFGSATDTTYNSGRLAWEATAGTTQIDDFGGGAPTSAPMPAPFPTAETLDDFSGPDEDPLAGNWSGPAYTWDDKGRRVNGTATSVSADFGGMYWNAATYSGDAEVFAKILQDGNAWLYLHWNPTSNTGYALEYDAAINLARLIRVTNGNETLLSASYVPLSAGDSFGLSKRGDVLQMWRKPPDGSWQQFGSATDSTYNSGRIAWEVAEGTTHIDDFGGGQSKDCVVCKLPDERVQNSVHGQRLSETSTLAARQYAYDKAGRLTHVESTSAGKCRVRDYTYDADSNRQTLTSRPPHADGSCDTTASGAVTTSTYDSADRILTTDGTENKYEYDSLGRITTTPGVAAGGSPLTATYYADDRVRSLTQGSVKKTYTLDPLRRTRAEAIDGAGTTVQHYSDDGDSPSWTIEGSRWTRNIAGLDGNLIATHDSQDGVRISAVNLHGDVVGTTAQEGLASITDADEFGNPNGPTSPRYQWLGAKRRATSLDSGVILMGQRVYAPGIGRFLQVDPVPGGSASDYDYAYQDPINNLDLDGRACIRPHPRVIPPQVTFYVCKQKTKHLWNYLNRRGQSITNRVEAACSLLGGLFADTVVGAVAGAGCVGFLRANYHRVHQHAGEAYRLKKCFTMTVGTIWRPPFPPAYHFGASKHEKYCKRR